MSQSRMVVADPAIHAHSGKEARCVETACIQYIPAFKTLMNHATTWHVAQQISPELFVGPRYGHCHVEIIGRPCKKVPNEHPAMCIESNTFGSNMMKTYKIRDSHNDGHRNPTDENVMVHCGFG